MRLSKLNINKININDIDHNYSIQNILIKLGELYQFENGIYGYGNLWVKIRKNIEKIIIEELDKDDCIQVEFPTLQPKNIWVQSNRWDTYTKDTDTLFTVECNLGEYGLAPTAEECATIFGANRLKSEKNLPCIYYQIGEKYRKEIRTRGYLFRPRTFTMMDAYSFDKDEVGMRESYNKMHEVYLKIFKRLGINIISVVSDNGTMGGRIAEEWMTITKYGEDTILYDKEKNIGLNKEILKRPNFQEYLRTEYDIKDISQMKEYHAMELGNNFQLGTKYSENMKLRFASSISNDNKYYMGCYGIGVGRIIATILENSLIERNNKIIGFSLPEKIAPYKLQIIYKDDKKELAGELYQKLLAKNVNCIIDDRENLSLGNRIKDAYVLGTPYILILGDKSEDNKYELENTKTNEKDNVGLEDLLNKFKDNY